MLQGINFYNLLIYILPFKMIKVHGWENIFAEKIHEKRDKDLHSIVRLQRQDAETSFLWLMSNFLVSISVGHGFDYDSTINL